ncbi:MAG: ABC transporter ATP-binding protein [Candidatus Dadabacteria bacterium]|nr:MAG: ABC transporter ATP-binding protein [Candidatus Dadabacteria bacterium]
MTKEKLIEIENVSKQYGSFKAVNDISLDVYSGEIFGFLGVNGAGKTTTLRMLAGVLRPTAGRIRLGGFDIEEEPLKAKAITGYIPDRPYIYSKLTGREFLYFIADLYSMDKKEAEESIDKYLAEYSLVEWQDELIESYSHGMRQRLATCAALIHKPKILIIDEPMVGLDPHGAKLLKDCMRRYAREGMAIMLSTHSLNVAEEVSDRIAIIHKGSILTVGTLDEIRSQTGGFNDGLESMFLQLTSQAGQELEH